MNLTAYAAWLAAADGATELDVVDALTDAFSVERSAIADDVRRVLAELVTRGLLVFGETADPALPAHPDCAPDEPRGRPPEPHGDHWHLPLEDSRCQATVDAQPWAETVAVTIGRFVVGVRTDAPATAVVVRHLLGGHVVDDDVPPTFSLVLGPPPRHGGGFRRRGLYEGRTWMTASEDPAEILSTLVARIDALSATPPAQVRLAAVAVARGGDAVVVPVRRGVTVPPAAAWRAHGFAVAAGPVLLGDDAGRPTVSTAPVTMTLDADVAERTALHRPLTARVRAVVLPRVPNTRTEACAALVPFLHTAPDDLATDVLDRLAALVADLELRELGPTVLEAGVEALLS